MLTRDQYGYPLELRLMQAQYYAAQARERNQRCTCHRCIEAEQLEAVQNILNNRESGGTK